MTDEIDRAADEAERYLSEALRQRKPEAPGPTGRCLFCDEIAGGHAEVVRHGMSYFLGKGTEMRYAIYLVARLAVLALVSPIFVLSCTCTYCCERACDALSWLEDRGRG